MKIERRSDRHLQMAVESLDRRHAAWLSLPPAADPQPWADAAAALVSRGYRLADAAVLAGWQLTGSLPRWSDRPGPAEPSTRPAAPPLHQAVLGGIYPIIPDVQLLPALLAAGAPLVQIRDKQPQTVARRLMIREAMACWRDHRHQLLVINDDWQAAVELGAPAIHLGQEDLDLADVQAIHDSGLRLGISTHSPYELARALAFSPDYVALGPIHQTFAKAMPWVPQGFDTLRFWTSVAPCPVVAIGGLGLQDVQPTRAAGAWAMAVISAVTRPPKSRDHGDAPSPAEAFKALQQAWQAAGLGLTPKSSLPQEP